MVLSNFDGLAAQISRTAPVSHSGFIAGTDGNLLLVKGLSAFCSVGDIVDLPSVDGRQIGEVVGLTGDILTVLPAKGLDGCAVNGQVTKLSSVRIAPHRSWLGRVIDPFGAPLDHRPLASGPQEIDLQRAPPDATGRKRLGPRLETDLAAFNTLLPIVRGQRVGLFAGSGVGKSTLLADLARGIECDVVVLALVGERGRELRDFVEDVLGPEGLAKTVVVAATSDQPALVRRRAAWASMSVAEFFRDQGAQVLYLCDSLTRFADAHREVATAVGEAIPSGGLPASTTQAVMGLCERAGPGAERAGDITAVFSVLVAGSDMEEPLADCVRGVLDGHVVLDRAIAERGRFPAVDILRSVSRSLPDAASAEENNILTRARASMASYRDVELMLQAGLYTSGSNDAFDRAIAERPKLEAFLAQKGLSCEASFARLEAAVSETKDRMSPSGGVGPKT